MFISNDNANVINNIASELSSLKNNFSYFGRDLASLTSRDCDAG
jgi:hypothetical protein